MRISADRARCEGHGICVNQAPRLLDLDEEDIVVVLDAGEEVAEADLPQAHIAAESCPVAALRVVPS